MNIWTQPDRRSTGKRDFRKMVQARVADSGSALSFDSSLRQQWYRSGDGFIFVFSITARETFDELPRLYDEIRRAREEDGSGIPCVIVANKCDLKERRQVSSTEARALAKRFGCPFVETSAKTGVNIDLAFRQCARRVLRTYVSILLGSLSLVDVLRRECPGHQ